MMTVKNLVLGLIIINSLTLFGQNQITTSQENIEILNCDKLKYGLYHSFTEFKNNDPSDTNFIIKLEMRLPVEQQYGYGNEQKSFIYDENGKPVEMDKPLWGFCDGEKVFIYSNHMYFEIITLGKFCVFTIEDYKRMRGRYKTRDYFFDINTGEVFELNSENLIKMVLHNDPILLEEFNNDRAKNSMMHWYVNEINSKYNNQ